MKKLIYTLVILAFVSSVNGQWVQLNNTSSWLVNDIAISGSYVFAATGDREQVIDNGIVYRSSNNGNNWQNVLNMTSQANSFAISGNNIFVGGDGDSIKSNIFLSTNNGLNWTLKAIPNVRGDLRLKIYGNTLYAVVNQWGIYSSINNGSSWSTVWEVDMQLHNLVISGPNMLVIGKQLYLSTNNGATWDTIKTGGLPPNIQGFESLEVNGGNVYMGIYPGGLYKSINNGYNWSNIFSILFVGSIDFSGNNIFVGTMQGLYKSSNEGLNWSAKNEGLNNNRLVWTFANDANYAYIDSRGYNDTSFIHNGIWRRPFSEVIGIQNISTEIPSTYSLSQNYPNPFNPTTKIRFDIPACHSSGSWNPVNLIVYDILGKEVATLVNESLKPGTYEATFDASMLTSGIYFYKLVTDGFTETKKMLMIK